MSDSQPSDVVTVASDGVTVTKEFKADEFPVPAIAFEFVSERDIPVSVRLVDAVPSTVSVKDLGFHPEFGSEHWTIQDGQIVFEKELEPDSTYTTVYGIRGTGTTDVQQFLSEPDLERVDPPLAEDAEQGDEDEPETEAIPGVVPEQTDEEEDASGPEGGDQSPPPDTELGEPIEAETETARPDGVDSTPDFSDIMELIRSGELSDEQIGTLRSAVGEDRHSAGSIDARLESLEGDVTKLRAYTDGLEEFLDETGRLDQLVEEFRSEISSLRDRHESLESTVRSNDEEVEDVRAEIDALRTDFDELQTDIESISSEVSALNETSQDLERQVASIEHSVDELKESITSMRATVPDEDLSEQLADVQEEVADLRQWQQQFKSMFSE